MFSEKVTEGASSVPEAVLMIAESSAPKNITWAKIGVWASMSWGSTCWLSLCW
jgi:hypothetical protein